MEHEGKLRLFRPSCGLEFREIERAIGGRGGGGPYNEVYRILGTIFGFRFLKLPHHASPKANLFYSLIFCRYIHLGSVYAALHVKGHVLSSSTNPNPKRQTLSP